MSNQGKPILLNPYYHDTKINVGHYTATFTVWRTLNTLLQWILFIAYLKYAWSINMLVKKWLYYYNHLKQVLFYWCRPSRFICGGHFNQHSYLSSYFFWWFSFFLFFLMNFLFLIFCAFLCLPWENCMMYFCHTFWQWLELLPEVAWFRCPSFAPGGTHKFTNCSREFSPFLVLCVFWCYSEQGCVYTRRCHFCYKDFFTANKGKLRGRMDIVIGNVFMNHPF